MMQSSHKKWGKLASLGAVAVLSFSVLAACGDKADDTAKGNDTEVSDTANVKDGGKVLATYDGGQITEEQFTKEMNVVKFLQPTYASMMDTAEVKNYFLKQQVAYQYLASKATAEEKKKGEELANEQMKQLINQVGEEQAEALLSESNINMDVLKSYMVGLFTAMQYMGSQVTDKEIKETYDADPKSFIVADVRHILIAFKTAEGEDRTDADALKLAKEIKAKLDAGADFSELAKQYSDDTVSAQNGGLMKDAQVTQFVEPFKKASMEQKVGAVGDPVKTEFGYHIILVDSRTDTLSEDVKEKIRNNLTSEKVGSFLDKDVDSIIKSIEKFEDPKTEEVAPEGHDTKNSQDQENNEQTSENETDQSNK